MDKKTFKSRLENIISATLPLFLLWVLLVATLTGIVVVIEEQGVIPSDASSITNIEKQHLILQWVEEHRNDGGNAWPTEVILAMIFQEGGEGAFYTSGNYSAYNNYIYGPWTEPDNTWPSRKALGYEFFSDGVMQVTPASGYNGISGYGYEYSYTYNGYKFGGYLNTQEGYEAGIDDGIAYLDAMYASYRGPINAIVHYNTGPNTIWIYKNGMGDPHYLEHIAEKLSTSVPSLYGLSNQAWVDALEAGQQILDEILGRLHLGKDVAYYEPYQNELDQRLRLIPAKIEPSLLNRTALASEGCLNKNQVRIIASWTTANFEGTPLILAPSLYLSSLTISYDEVTKFADNPLVEHVWPDCRVHASLNESVPRVKNPTRWKQIERQWGMEINGSGITIAILDSGIDKTHPDLNDLDDDDSTNDPKVIMEKDFTDTGYAWDDAGHGTWCASIAAGTGEASNYTFVGMAPGAWLLNGKVLNSEGWGYTSGMIDGINWAVENGADVISLSLETQPNPWDKNPGDDALSKAVDWAVSQGVVVVAAAGNHGHLRFMVSSPGCARRAITVGATTKEDELASFTSFGPTGDGRVKPEVSAPGVDVIGARAKNTSLGHVINEYYVRASGTSASTPLVAGLAALLLQIHPEWSPEVVKAAIVETAQPLNYSIYQAGNGRVQAVEAVNPPLLILPSTLNLGKLLRVDGQTNISIICWQPVNVSLQTEMDANIDVNLFPEKVFSNETVQITLTQCGEIDKVVTGFITASTIRTPILGIVSPEKKIIEDWREITRTYTEHFPHRLLIENQTLYVGHFTYSGTILKVNLSDLSIIDQVELKSCIDSLTSHGDFLYAGTKTWTGWIYKIRKQPFEIVSKLETGERDCVSLAVMGEYLYVSYPRVPALVKRVNINSFTVDLTKTFENDYTLRVFSYGGRLYAVSYISYKNDEEFSRVYELSENLTILKEVWLNGKSPVDMEFNGNSMYLGLYGFTYPSSIVKVNLSSFAVEKTLQLSYDDWRLSSIAYHQGVIYGTLDYKIVAVDALTMQKIGYLIPRFANPRLRAVGSDGEFLYVSADRSGEESSLISKIETGVSYKLSILGEEGGTTNPPPGTYYYPQNENVPITAVPYKNYSFSHWTVNGESTINNPLTLTMNCNYIVQPHFKPLKTFQVKIYVFDAFRRMPVRRARVYVDGVFQGFTDSHGRLDVNLSAEIHTLTVLKRGYFPCSFPLLVEADTQKTVYLLPWWRRWWWLILLQV